jgi:Family of unknown function (DUF6194)
VDIEGITGYITSALPGVDVQVAREGDGSPDIARGDSFFFFDPDRKLEGARKFPFATIVIKDYGDFDNASNLDRPGVFRLNLGISKQTFESLFADDAVPLDFTQLDVLLPHPIYGKNHWVCVLNPSEATFDSLKPLIAEAHGIAKGRYDR